MPALSFYESQPKVRAFGTCPGCLSCGASGVLVRSGILNGGVLYHLLRSTRIVTTPRFVAKPTVCGPTPDGRTTVMHNARLLPEPVPSAQAQGICAPGSAC